MKADDFQRLLRSVKQIGTITKGGNFRHRKTTLTELDVKVHCERTGLTHADFSHIIGVRVPSLQYWEQGPTTALLRVVERDPQAALSSLHV